MTEKVLPTSAETSPDALLKQAILGARASAVKAAADPAARIARAFRLDRRLAASTAAALGIGVLLGAGAMGVASPRSAQGVDAVDQARRQIEALRTDSERQVERLSKLLAQVQESTDAARSDAKARNATLTERVGRAEQALTTRITTMGERLEQADKEQSGRLAALAGQIEKRAIPPVAPVSTPQAARVTAEPTETGTLADRTKAAVSENWAVRDVYDGVAMLEDRKRRLVEVGRGDTVPGVGRVETIERRGKTWVVVTKQGIITPQTW